MSTSQYTEPKSYVEVCKYACWQQAMKDELDALAKNKTWTVVDLPPNVIPIGNNWVYKIKHKVDGSVDRFKA